MNPSIISVPFTYGVQGLSVSDYVLDRVSGDVEKNLGQVVEAAFAGASVPVSVLIVLEAVSMIRRAFVFLSDDLPAGMKSADDATRRGIVEDALQVILPAGAPSLFEVGNPDSTLKGKEWVAAGLIQTASIAGSCGFVDIDAALTPAKKQLTVAALTAKLEDLALSPALGGVAIFVNQSYPEIHLSTAAGGLALGAADADVVAEFAAPIAKVNAVFQSASTEVNPKFGFESGGSF